MPLRRRCSSLSRCAKDGHRLNVTAARTRRWDSPRTREDWCVRYWSGKVGNVVKGQKLMLAGERSGRALGHSRQREVSQHECALGPPAGLRFVGRRVTP